MNDSVQHGFQAIWAEEYCLNKRIAILLLNKGEAAVLQMPILLKALSVSGRPERPLKMSIFTIKHLFRILLLFIATMFMMSCLSTSKAVYQTKGAGSKIRFYISDNPNYSKGEGKFYARVDSGNVRMFYSFQEGNIYKTYKNVDNYVYTLVFDKVPELQLTSLDTNVLNSAKKLLDSLDYKSIKRPNGATGFVVEIARQ